MRTLVGNGSVVGGADDLNAITTKAVNVPALDGTRVFDFLAANVGKDGANTVGVNDVDLYKVTVLADGTLTVALNFDFDVAVRTFDSTGNQIGLQSVSGGGGSFSTGVGVNAGEVYYVGVSSFGNENYNIFTGANRTGGTGTFDYKVELSLTNGDPNGIIVGAEALRDFPYFRTGVIESDSPAIGAETRLFIGKNDVDMFKLVATDTGTMNIAVRSQNATANEKSLYQNVNKGTTNETFTVFDSILRIFDTNGNLLAINDNANGGTTDSFVSINVTKGQTIIAAVSGFGNNAYNPNDPNRPFSFGGYGSFIFDAKLDNGDVDGTAKDAFLADFGTNYSSNIGKDGLVTIGANGSLDVDFYRYLPTTDGVIDVGVVGQSGFKPNLAIWTFNAGKTDLVRIAETPDGTFGKRLATRVTANQEYFVSVTGQGNNGFLWFLEGSGPGGTTGNYGLDAKLRPLTDLSSLIDNSILNSKNARAISSGTTVFDSLGEDAISDTIFSFSPIAGKGAQGYDFTGTGDIDSYTFTAPANGVLTIDVAADSGIPGVTADPFVRVFNSAGQEIAFNDDANAKTRNSHLDVNVQSGQIYYISVGGSNVNARNFDILNGTGSATTTAVPEGSYAFSMTFVEGGTVPPTNPPTNPPTADYVEQSTRRRFRCGDIGASNRVQRRRQREVHERSVRGLHRWHSHRFR